MNDTFLRLVMTSPTLTGRPRSALPDAPVVPPHTTRRQFRPGLLGLTSRLQRLVSRVRPGGAAATDVS